VKRKRLLWQLYLSYLLITLLSLSAVAWYRSRSVRHFYIERTATDLEARAHFMSKYILRESALQNPVEVDGLCKELGKETATRITVILPSGEVIGDSDEAPHIMDNHGDRPEIKKALAGRAGISTRYSYTLEKDMMYLALPIIDHGMTAAVVRTSIPVTQMHRMLRTIYLRIAAGGLAVAVLAAVITLLISRRISRPLVDMKEGAEHFAEGNLEYRLQVPEVHEMASLANAMNEMASQLDERIRTILSQRNEQQAMLSSMVDALLAVDVEGRLINLNHAAARLLGVDIEAADKRALEEVVRNTALQEFVKRALSSEESIEDEIILRGKEEKFLKARGTRLCDVQGKRMGAVVVLSDVTDLRRLERIRSDFVANVSHELKTPITSIKGFVETLMDGAIKDAEDAQRFLEIIAKQSDRLNAIVDDLLSLAKIEENAEKERIPLAEARIADVLRDAVLNCEPKAVEKETSIDLDCSEDIIVGCDPQLIEQAVVNLIDNAIKYSDPGNRIIVNAEMDEIEVTIDVRDEGCGIDRVHLPRLFERFYRADKARSRQLGGTGLGLAIVKHIAQAHGGSVSVESEPGKGSIFTIHLPRS